MIKVGVNGYGTIGKRVADAINQQPDMKLIGVVKTRPDYKAKAAQIKGYPIYADNKENLRKFEERGMNVEGTIENLLDEVDIIVDATPGGVGVKYKNLYEKRKVKAIFQGGEKHNVAQTSFVAQCNYEEAYGKDYIRCVSCNTTGLCRILNVLDKAYGITEAYAVLVRRSADPFDVKKGPIDAIIPDPIQLPSHHALDVNTVLPKISIFTAAFKVPATHMHVHSLILQLKNKADEDSVIELLSNTSRMILVDGQDGFTSTAEIIEYCRDLGRDRNDLYENAIWADSIKVKNHELYLFQAIHQEAIVVPENIDAIRAAMEITGKSESIKLTNDMLGIK